jgi:anti-sigma B factor antagonist
MSRRGSARDAAERSITVVEDGGTVVVTVSGDADLLGAPRLRDAIAGVLDDGAKRIVVDLTGATFIDSATLGVLVAAAKRLAPDGSLDIVCADPGIRRIFEITLLDRVFDVHRTREQVVGRSKDEANQGNVRRG